MAAIVLKTESQQDTHGCAEINFVHRTKPENLILQNCNFNEYVNVTAKTAYLLYPVECILYKIFELSLQILFELNCIGKCNMNILHQL